MYAIIETGGKQYRVAPGDVIRVERLPGKAGEAGTLGRVLAVSADGEGMLTGERVANAKVEATIGFHKRGEVGTTISRVPALPPGELVLSDQDASFLKSLKIRLDPGDETSPD